jgi:hypothetical protein|tara:strand:+ start:53410 stop:53868 length:459 start_codon:yes stop_codon:yes gene_type:complete
MSQQSFNIQLMLAKELPWIMENKHGLNTMNFWNAWRDIMRRENGDFYEDNTVYPFPAKELSEKYKKNFGFTANLRVDERLFLTSVFQPSRDLLFYNTYAVKDSPEQLIVFSKCLAKNPAIWRDFILENEEFFIDPNENEKMGFGDHAGGFGG